MGYSISHGVRTVVNEPPKVLDPKLWQALDGIKSARVYAKGAQLFERGRPAHGVYFIEQGEVKVLLDPVVDPKKLFDLAGPGAVLVLSDCVSVLDYKVSAEAADESRVAYVERQALMDFLREHCELCMQIVRLLSEDLHSLYHKFRSMEPVSRKGKKSVRNVN